jgi:hypothetical protein
MAHFLTVSRRGVRGVLGVLLALHLGVAQAVMGPAPEPSHATVAAPVADAMDASPCHHAAVTKGGKATVPSDHPCCDAGQCHCPVFMTVAMSFDAQVLRPDFRLTSLPELPAARSLRPTPDLRPPIAS